MGDIGEASDVWSMGCLLYEVLVGDYLFSGEECAEITIRIVSRRLLLMTAGTFP